MRNALLQRSSVYRFYLLSNPFSVLYPSCRVPIASCMRSTSAMKTSEYICAFKVSILLHFAIDLSVFAPLTLLSIIVIVIIVIVAPVVGIQSYIMKIAIVIVVHGAKAKTRRKSDS